MRRIHIGLAAAAASALISPIVFAQNMQDVTVVGTRALTTNEVGQTSTGVTIIKISLTYGVGASDLDLASSAGAAELGKRIDNAAMAACKEITRQYPKATPSDEECAKAAAKKAMVKAYELEAAAAKKSAK
ncbi:MAG: UrcA family protein [Steroidobacterales bacterium]